MLIRWLTRGQTLLPVWHWGQTRIWSFHFCGKWIVAPLKEESVQEINAIFVYEVEKED